MAVNYLLISLIFILTFKTGFSLDSGISVFVQTGASVQLDIQTQELPEFDYLSWSNDKSENIVRHNNESKQLKIHPSYKDRVDFNNKTFSLTLKNMQKTDSGLYTAKTSGESDKNIVTYRVSVIDTVEAPVLTVNSNQSSSDYCTVNFTCRAHELKINSSYQNNRCSKEEVTSQINTLILYCIEESIICNHSNPVSWIQDRINILQLCDHKEKNSKNVQTKSFLLGPVVVSVAACSLIICLSVFMYCKCKKGAQEMLVEGSTVYAQVKAQEMQKSNSDCHIYDIPDQVEAQAREETADKQSNTTYCTVGQHQKPIPPESDRTIYSMVSKQPHKKPSIISPNDT